MKDEVKMDANRLIAEVYKRPALWNQRHISYHNREVTNRVWLEIATIFKLPSAFVKFTLSIIHNYFNIYFYLRKIANFNCVN